MPTTPGKSRRSERGSPKVYVLISNVVKPTIKTAVFRGLVQPIYSEFGDLFLLGFPQYQYSNQSGPSSSSCFSKSRSLHKFQRIKHQQSRPAGDLHQTSPLCISGCQALPSNIFIGRGRLGDFAPEAIGGSRCLHLLSDDLIPAMDDNHVVLIYHPLNITL